MHMAEQVKGERWRAVEQGHVFTLRIKQLGRGELVAEAEDRI